MSKANNLSDFLTDLAGAIKTKNGLNSVNAQNFKTEVNKMYGTADLETKSATPSESSQDITPSSGKVLTKVTVGAISSTYVGSGITSRNSNSLSASDATVTVPAGYYASQATKTVASGSLANSATNGVTYTELSTPILANGWLYINKGWIGNSKISLGTLIPDITNDAAAANILAGYKAYDEAGNVLTGTMGTLSLSDTYYTTTNTGYGVVTKKLYSGASDKYIIAGSATTPTESGASTSTSLSGTTLTVARSVTPTVSAGWVSSGTAGTVTITGTVPTETKSASGSGDITPSTGKLLSKVTVGSGSATPNASYATLSSAGSSATSVTSQYFKITPTASVGTAGWISSISNGTVQNYTVRSAATFSMTGSAVTDVVTIGTLSSGYYPVSAKVKGTVAASTSGWFSSSGAVQASSATQVGKIAAGTITNNTSGGTSTATINRGSQIKIGSGYYPNDLYYTAQANSGNIELTQATSTSVNGYSTATVRSASIAMPSSLSGTGASVSNSGTTLTLTKSVTNTATVTTTGWLSSLSGTTSLSLSATDSNFVASNIVTGATIFGLAGSAPPGVTEVSTADGMDAVLIVANVGKYYKYTGTSGMSTAYNYYINGCIYCYEA